MFLFLFIFYLNKNKLFYNLKVNACFNNPCLNGATCQTSGSAYVCICPAQFTGVNCQTCIIYFYMKVYFLIQIKFNFL